MPTYKIYQIPICAPLSLINFLSLSLFYKPMLCLPTRLSSRLHSAPAYGTWISVAWYFSLDLSKKAEITRLIYHFVHMPVIYLNPQLYQLRKLRKGHQAFTLDQRQTSHWWHIFGIYLYLYVMPVGAENFRHKMIHPRLYNHDAYNRVKRDRGWQPQLSWYPMFRKSQPKYTNKNDSHQGLSNKFRPHAYPGQDNLLWLQRRIDMRL